jgi:predicted DNA-binding transcriptional regulator AlpA
VSVQPDLSAGPPTPFLDRAQVAALLGCTVNTVSLLVQRGQLPRPIYLSRSMQRWSRETILDYLRSREDGKPPPPAPAKRNGHSRRKGVAHA